MFMRPQTSALGYFLYVFVNETTLRATLVAEEVALGTWYWALASTTELKLVWGIGNMISNR